MKKIYFLIATGFSVINAQPAKCEHLGRLRVDECGTVQRRVLTLDDFHELYKLLKKHDYNLEALSKDPKYDEYKAPVSDALENITTYSSAIKIGLAQKYFVLAILELVAQETKKGLKDMPELLAAVQKCIDTAKLLLEQGVNVVETGLKTIESDPTIQVLRK